MKICKGLLWCAVLAAFVGPAEATTIGLTGNGTWNSFGIDDQVPPLFGVSWIDTETLSPGYGSLLDFTFTIAADHIGTLTVVDAGFAGDTFTVTNGGSTLGLTSPVPVQDIAAAPFVLDFDAAFADPAFSRGVFFLGPGSYHIGGSLAQSVTDGGVPLNATFGALKLDDASAVAEPTTMALMFVGLAALGVTARRRKINS